MLTLTMCFPIGLPPLKLKTLGVVTLTSYQLHRRNVKKMEKLDLGSVMDGLGTFEILLHPLISCWSAFSPVVAGLGTFENPLHSRMIFETLLGLHCTGAWYPKP